MNFMRLRIGVLFLAATLLAGAALGQDAQTQDAEPPAIGLETVVEGLVSPVELDSPPDDARRFVVDRVGIIYRLTEDGSVAEEPFLDIQDRVVELREGFDERGLLGMAFHPNYAENGRYYVYYSAPLREQAPDDWNHTARISEFKAAQPGEEADEEATRAEQNTTDMNSERVLMRIDQPQFNHNAGAIAFGPDGYLYIALGDGGAGNDVGIGHPPMGHGQDTRSLLGNILRIDVDRGWPGYAVPEDNPFVGEQEPDEIWSWGWRNPWRMTFDRDTGHLYAATNGQSLWEAVYETSRPGNYGWNILEGTHCFNPENATDPPEQCAAVGEQGEPLELPVIEYPHPDNQGDYPVAGVSVVGGFVYRGEAIPELQGYYVFGDWQSQLFASRVDESDLDEPRNATDVAGGETYTSGEAETWPVHQLMEIEPFILGFGEDSQGELYVTTTETSGPTGETGAVHRIVAAGEGDADVGAQPDAEDGDGEGAQNDDEEDGAAN